MTNNPALLQISLLDLGIFGAMHNYKNKVDLLNVVKR